MNGLAAAVVLISILLSVGLMYLFGALLSPNETTPHVKVLGIYSPLLSTFKYRSLPKLKGLPPPVLEAWSKVRAASHWPRFWRVAGIALELAIVVAWALWVGRSYLDLNPEVWVNGVDAPDFVLPYFQWQLAPQCGGCVLWNGSVSGGAPAFSELTAGMLHPVLIGLVLLFGAVDASKLAVVVGLASAGLAQWWLARWMRLGALARVWSAMLVVTAGHLAARMDSGTVGIVFSAGFCALVIPASLELIRSGRRRAAVGLAFWLALAVLSGQGYLQMALVLAIFPALLVFILDIRQGHVAVGNRWREFALAGIVSLLLTAVLWVPALHTWPNMVKESDANFQKAQPLEYVPLNLVINNVDFYRSDVLSKDPAVATNAIYIGWLPVCLALFAIPSLGRAHLRWLAFFFTAMVLLLLLSSAVLFKWIQPVFPEIAKIRYPPMMTSLLIPLILGLSAWGVEQIWRMKWPSLTVVSISGLKLELGLSWLLLLPLALALKSTYDFSQKWLQTTPAQRDGTYRIFNELRPATTQWVTVPNSDPYIALVAVDLGLKVTKFERQGRLSEPEFPPAILETSIGAVDASVTPVYRQIDNVIIVDHPENEYAFVDTGQARVPCQAHAQGGNIDVDCQTTFAGQLIVHENQWPGWQVWRNHQPAQLRASPWSTGQWLTADAPAGQNHFEFRYRPWDVYLGFALTLLGVALAIGLWIRSPRLEVEPQDQ